MTNKKIIVGTIFMLVSLGNAIPVKAAESVQNQAQTDAQKLVLSQKKVNEAALQQCDPEYIAAFLQAFEEESSTYERAYRQGISDAREKKTHSYANPVAQLGYQKGVKQGERLSKETVTSSDKHLPLEKQQEQPLLPIEDHQTYSVKEPTINQAKFINRLAKVAQQIGAQYDLYPSVIIAQAALESDWGTSELGSAPYFNLFGVKGYFAGKTVNKPTSEYTVNGKKYQINSNFRRYSNDLEALQDYAQTLTDPLYISVHRHYAKTYRDATKALVGKYATDPHYNQKLNQLIEEYQLTRYDKSPQNSNHSHKIREAAAPIYRDRLTSQPIQDQKHNKEQIKEKSPLSKSLPLVGGIGSAGLLEVIRKLILK